MTQTPPCLPACLPNCLPTWLQVGQQCKELLDLGRLQWLQRQQQVAVAEMVQYIQPSVSGENRLLLARLAVAA